MEAFRITTAVRDDAGDTDSVAYDGSELDFAVAYANRQRQDKVSRFVADAAARGKAPLGGKFGDRLFSPPTIVAGLRNGRALLRKNGRLSRKSL